MLILNGKLKCVDRLAFSPDGSRVVAAGGEFRPLEVRSSFDPDAPVLLLDDVRLGINDWHFAFDHRDDTMIVADSCELVGYDTITGNELWRVLPVEDECLAGFALSPDCERIAFGFIHQYTSEDGYQLWKRAAGQPPKRMKATNGSDNETCLGVAMLDGGKQMAFVEYEPDYDKISLLLIPTTRGKRRIIPTELRECRQIAVSPDGQLIAILTRRTVAVWNIASPDDTPATFQVKGRMAMTDIAFHPSGRFIAVTSNDTTVTLFDTQSWKIARTFTWNVGRLRGVAFSPDGMRAAVGSDTGKIVVWDVDV